MVALSRADICLGPHHCALITTMYQEFTGSKRSVVWPLADRVAPINFLCYLAVRKAFWRERPQAVGWCTQLWHDG